MKRSARDLLGRLPLDAVELLERYAVLLEDKAIPMGFVSAGDRSRVMERHVLDSLRAVSCIEPSERTIADLGSGAGLPGIPVAVAMPDRLVILVEPMRRRAAFLEFVAGVLGLANVRVVIRRAEEAGLSVDVCLVRAVVDAPKAWEMARMALARWGRLLYFAGKSWSATEDRVTEPHVVAQECDAGHLEGYGPIVIMREGARRTGHGGTTAG